jgi:hypothetical protein
MFSFCSKKSTAVPRNLGALGEFAHFHNAASVQSGVVSAKETGDEMPLQKMPIEIG